MRTAGGESDSERRKLRSALAEPTAGMSSSTLVVGLNGVGSSGFGSGHTSLGKEGVAAVSGEAGVLVGVSR